MVFPSIDLLLPASLGGDRLVFGSIGNAAQDGKRLRVIDASGANQPVQLTA
jgi:hypothetical protein